MTTFDLLPLEMLAWIVERGGIEVRWTVSQLDERCHKAFAISDPSQRMQVGAIFQRRYLARILIKEFNMCLYSSQDQQLALEEAIKSFFLEDLFQKICSQYYNFFEILGARFQTRMDGGGNFFSGIQIDFSELDISLQNYLQYLQQLFPCSVIWEAKGVFIKDLFFRHLFQARHYSSNSFSDSKQIKEIIKIAKGIDEEKIKDQYDEHYLYSPSQNEYDEILWNFMDALLKWCTNGTNE